MPKQSPKFISDYIVPALDDGTYGNSLYWVNRNEGIFKIKWLHKNSAQWNADDAVVFTDWDKMKERTGGVSDVDYYMKAKQRFRAALSKLEVQVLERNENGYRTYKLNACHIHNISSNKENIRPVSNNVNKIPVARNSRAEENNQLSVINDVDRNAAEILMMLSVKSKPAETYVPRRPNVLYIQARGSNVEQLNMTGPEEHEDVHMQEEDTIGIQEQDKIVQHDPMQQSLPRKIKIITEAPSMFVIPTYNDV